MIYLRSTVEVYEAARAAMDTARGLPAEGQTTSFTPAVDAPKDDQGRVYLGLRETDMAATGAGDMLSPLVTGGLVEMIDEAAYEKMVLAWTPPRETPRG